MTPLDPDLAVPGASATTLRFRRTLSVLVGLAAVAAASFSWIEADGGRKEEQSFVKASRGALEIFVKIAASSPRAQFEGNALRRAIVVQAESTGRVAGGKLQNDELFEEGLRQAAADERAGNRLIEIAQQMSAVAEEFPSLDPATLEAISVSSPAALEGLVEEQNAALDEADRYGTRQERSFFSLGLVASAAALIGLAGLMGVSRAGWISLFTAAGALAVAVAWTASAFI